MNDWYYDEYDEGSQSMKRMRVTDPSLQEYLDDIWVRIGVNRVFVKNILYVRKDA